MIGGDTTVDLKKVEWTLVMLHETSIDPSKVKKRGHFTFYAGSVTLVHAPSLLISLLSFLLFADNYSKEF